MYIYSIHILNLYTVHVYSSLFFQTASLWETNSPFLPILDPSLHVLMPFLLKQIVAMTLSAFGPRLPSIFPPITYFISSPHNMLYARYFFLS